MTLDDQDRTSNVASEPAQARFDGRDVLLIFVKAPRSGTVKTRLVADIGSEAAAELYRVLAEEVIRRTRPAGEEYARMLFFTPKDAEPEIRAWIPNLSVMPQSGEDLGARMHAAFVHAFALGARRVALIGSDAPWVDRNDVNAALDALGENDMALGAAADGGYYLVALSRPRHEVFRDIAWSTANVLESTLARAAGLGWRVRRLPPKRDMDTLEDLRLEWDRLRTILLDRPKLLRALEAHMARSQRQRPQESVPTKGGDGLLSRYHLSRRSRQGR